MKKSILFLLIFPILVFCQTPGQPVTFQTVFSSLHIINPNTYISPVLNNIGQTGHLITAHTTSCSGVSTDNYELDLIVSVDNSHYFILASTTQITNGDVYFFGAGAFPYKKIQIQNVTSNDCVVTVSYAGSISGVNAGIAQSPCNSWVTRNYTNTAVQSVLGPVANQATHICMLALSMASAGDLQISIGTSDCSGGLSPIIIDPYLVAGGNITLGNGDTVIYTLPSDSSICSVASAGNSSITVKWGIW